MPGTIRRYEPWQGRNPFSSSFRRLFNQVAEAAARFCELEARIQESITRHTDFEEEGGEGPTAPFPVRLNTATISSANGVWEYEGWRVAPYVPAAGMRPRYRAILGEDMEPVEIGPIWNRAEEWNDSGEKETIRKSYGIQVVKDVDDEFCIRLVPIGESDDMGQPPPAGDPEPPKNVVVWVTAETAAIDNAPMGQPQTETVYFFSAGNEVDVECCPPCDSFPDADCMSEGSLSLIERLKRGIIPQVARGVVSAPTPEPPGPPAPPPPDV